ncbi:AhpD family alkylhydroperoxidase [Kitasatospora sp. SolWspMP-SS2h]|uniref:carboxymuconolactone decarboxylase family protein n=1 Tax=Kitasatospora sp. SolWspMP-SS2h TaxID=1305729 RepID=UPI000DC05149|nr:carboxymuconolactone decarboxylase family protein [Kitasatospora sp. SolWspMP-SS2h]RAJ31961.1 AhpD family alkylhydroperoxidase [Kitasatospora sp. SolWspMP-SS2h]
MTETLPQLPAVPPLPMIELGPQAFAAVHALHGAVEEAAAAAGLEPPLLELVRLRCSQLNGCVYCVDLHTTAARKAGERDERLAQLVVWRESELFTPRERAALALAEAVTRLTDRAEGVRARRAASAVLSEPEAAFVAWAAAVVNTYNRIAVTSRPVAAGTP